MIWFFFYEKDGKWYSLIKNVSRLCRSQITLNTNNEVYICKKCFIHYTKDELLQKHVLYCSRNETVAVKMPPRNTKLCFKNYYKQLHIPIVVYAGFKCFTKPISTCSPDPNQSYSYNYQKHEPSGFCLYLKGLDSNTKFKPILYTEEREGDDVAEKFVSKISWLTNRIYNDFYCQPKRLKLTKQE